MRDYSRSKKKRLLQEDFVKSFHAMMQKNLNDKVDTDFDFLIEENGLNTLLIGGHKGYVMYVSQILKAALEDKKTETRPLISLRLNRERPTGHELGKAFVSALYGIDATNNLSHEEVLDMGILAEMHKAELTYPIVCSAINRTVNNDNCHDTYNWTDSFDRNVFETVRSFCKEHMRRNIVQTLRHSDEWSFEIWNNVLDFEWEQNEGIEQVDEVTLFRRLMRWTNSMPDYALPSLRLFPKIRYGLMTLYQLYDVVHPFNILSSEDFNKIENYVRGKIHTGFLMSTYCFKQRQFVKVKDTQELKDAILKYPGNVHIKLGVGIFNGPFVYNTQTHYTNVHISGKGVNFSFLRFAYVDFNPGIFDCKFNNSSISDLTVLTGWEIVTPAEERKVVFEGNGNYFFNIEFANTRMCVKGKYCKFQNLEFNGGMKDERAKIYGEFSNSTFEQIKFMNAELGISLGRLCYRNTFKEISFSQCLKGFDLDTAKEHTIQQITFKYSSSNNNESTTVIHCKGAKENVVSFVTSEVSSQFPHYAIIVDSGFRGGSGISEFNKFDNVNSGDIFVNGRHTFFKECINIRNLELQLSTESVVVGCRGQKLTKPRYDLTLEIENCDFSTTEVLDI